ncbi:MAG: DUF29 domain-containing protein [Spirulina sp. SIO3F2]|nr:DUF29 domain-containing protein [Spirulina sp. SIO3F2]
MGGLLPPSSTSLRTYPEQKLVDSYQCARRQAAQQTQLAIATFPQNCPYAIESVLAEDWLPQYISKQKRLSRSPSSNPNST